MNATLQCLADIKKISEYFINLRKDKKFTDNNKYKLSKEYSSILNRLYFSEENKKYIAPYEFRKIIAEMNPYFRFGDFMHPKKILIFLSEHLHSELNKTEETNLSIIMPDNINTTNQQQVFQCFTGEFKKKYNSIISKYFYGTSTSMTLCHRCNKFKYSFQFFSFIIFPLL